MTPGEQELVLGGPSWLQHNPSDWDGWRGMFSSVQFQLYSCSTKSQQQPQCALHCKIKSLQWNGETCFVGGFLTSPRTQVDLKQTKVHSLKALCQWTHSRLLTRQSLPWIYCTFCAENVELCITLPSLVSKLRFQPGTFTACYPLSIPFSTLVKTKRLC